MYRKAVLNFQAVAKYRMINQCSLVYYPMTSVKISAIVRVLENHFPAWLGPSPAQTAWQCLAISVRLLSVHAFAVT